MRRPVVPLALLLLGLLAAAPTAGAQVTIAPPGADCFPWSEKDRRDDDDYAKWTPDIVPTVAISGVRKERSGQSLRAELSNTPPARSLFDGTAGLDPDSNGNILVKYPPGMPDTIFTNGDALPTPKTEVNTMNFRYFLNDVEKGSGQVSFRIGILAATAPIKEKVGQRKKSVWKVSGLGPGTYWAFFRKGGKTIGKLKLGGASGPCGYLTTRQYTKPKKKVKGRFDIVIQNSATFRKDVNYLLYTGRSTKEGLFGFGEFTGIYAPVP